MSCGRRWARTSDIKITSSPLNRPRHTFRQIQVVKYDIPPICLFYNDIKLCLEMSKMMFAQLIVQDCIQEDMTLSADV